MSDNKLLEEISGAVRNIGTKLENIGTNMETVLGRLEVIQATVQRLEVTQDYLVKQLLGDEDQNQLKKIRAIQ